MGNAKKYGECEMFIKLLPINIRDAAEPSDPTKGAELPPFADDLD